MTARVHNLRKKAGFTLIEMLVYIAILSIVSGGALTLLFSLTDQINTGRAERVMTQSATIALDRILHEVRAADYVDIYYSTLLTTPGVLTLMQGASTTVFSTSGTALLMSKDGVSYGPLTHEKATVDAVRFYRYNNGTTELVRVELTLTAVVGDATVTKHFSAATMLRGSYD